MIKIQIVFPIVDWYSLVKSFYVMTGANVFYKIINNLKLKIVQNVEK